MVQISCCCVIEGVTCCSSDMRILGWVVCLVFFFLPSFQTLFTVAVSIRMNVGLGMLLLGFEDSHFPTCSLSLRVSNSSVLGGLEGMRFLQVGTLQCRLLPQSLEVRTVS